MSLLRKVIAQLNSEQYWSFAETPKKLEEAVENGELVRIKVPAFVEEYIENMYPKLPSILTGMRIPTPGKISNWWDGGGGFHYIVCLPEDEGLARQLIADAKSSRKNEAIKAVPAALNKAEQLCRRLVRL